MFPRDSPKNLKFVRIQSISTISYLTCSHQSFFISLYHLPKMADSTPKNVFPAGILPFAERKFPKTICMFDVDGTLSLARQSATPAMQAALKKLRSYTAVAFVGGSDLNKIVEQLHVQGENGKLYLMLISGLMRAEIGS